jgi:hypothetical protein
LNLAQDNDFAAFLDGLRLSLGYPDEATASAMALPF